MPEIGWAGNPVKLVAFHFIVGNLSQMQKELLKKHPETFQKWECLDSNTCIRRIIEFYPTYPNLFFVNLVLSIQYDYH